MNEDERLVRLVQRGDQHAFVQLIENHQRAIHSLCYRMTGNAADAEDLTQETFLRFYSSASRLRPGSPLRPWLHKIAANATLDALRKRKPPARSLLADDEDLTARIVDHRPSPEEAFLIAEKRALIQQALLERVMNLRREVEQPYARAG